MNKLRVSGTIEKIVFAQGKSKFMDKDWTSTTLILQTSDNPQFPEIVAIEFFNDDNDQILRRGGVYNEGEKVDIDCWVRSREFNGKFYHTIRGNFLRHSSDSEAPAKQEAPATPAESATPAPENIEPTDDLPF